MPRIESPSLSASVSLLFCFFKCLFVFPHHATAYTDPNHPELPSCISIVPNHGWPEQGIPRRSDYTMLSQLCVSPAANGADENSVFNFGCVCNMRGMVECDFDHQLLILLNYCSQGCYCRKRRHRPRWKEIIRSLLGRSRPIYPEETYGMIGDDVAKERPERQAAGGAAAGRLLDLSDPGNQEQCGGYCSSFQGCDIQRNRRGCENIICKAKAASAGKYFGLGTCSTAYSDLGKRNGVDGPICHCNQTYVSTSCCWAEDGIVFEIPESPLPPSMYHDCFEEI